MTNPIKRLGSISAKRAKGAAQDLQQIADKQKDLIGQKKQLREKQSKVEGLKARSSDISALSMQSVVKASIGALHTAAKRDADIGIIMSMIGGLKPELAKVELKIKQLLQELQNARGKEEAERDRVAGAEQGTSQVLKNLEKAADALSELRKTVGIVS